MTPSIRNKLTTLAERHQEISLLLAQPEIIDDNRRFRDLSREYAQLEPLVQSLAEHDTASRELEDTRALLADPELGEMAAADAERLEARLAQLDNELKLMLLPSDPRDQANLFLEIRAGSGGDEAALFAGNLLRMYSRFAERQHWQMEILSESPGEHGGYKEVVARIEGDGAYSKLKFESGTHCVKRIPETESQGRMHTSTATVAVLPEIDETENIEIDPAQIRTDTFRASGAGGQHVNKTDSAIRITHLPSGIVVKCQDERSQHKNRARALGLLKAHLMDRAQAEKAHAQAESRRLQIGSGERSQRIRTYRFKDNLVTDHRIDLSLHRLTEILAGDLNELIDTLSREQQADQLQALATAR